MALVSKKLYESWYKEDTFIRRNFFYIFQNPLWDKGLPKGFSLCPMFWMSILIGFLLLKCFFVPLMLTIMLITKLTIMRADARFSKWTKEHLRDSKYDVSDMPDSGWLILIGVAGTIVPLILFFFSNILVEHVIFNIYRDSIPFMFWLTVFGIFLISGCIRYYKKNEYDSERCRVSKYVIAFLFTWSASFVYLRFDIFSTTAIATWKWIKWISVAGWECLINLFASIGYGISWFFAGDAYSGVPAVAIFLGGLLMTYLFSRIAMKMDDSQKSSRVPLSRVWEFVIDNCLYSHEKRRSGRSQSGIDIMGLIKDVVDHFKLNEQIPFENKVARRLFYYEVASRFIQNHNRIDLKEHLVHLGIDIKGDSISQIDFKKFKEKEKINYVINLTSHIHNVFIDMGRTNYALCDNDYKNDPYNVELKKVIDGVIKDLNDFFKIKFKLTEKNRKAAEKRSGMCKVMTGIVGAPFVMSWSIVSGIAKFIGAICQYTWDVFKAKKQMACPYVQFENTEGDEDGQ